MTNNNSGVFAQQRKEPVTYVVRGWCAFNLGGKPPINEISFDQTEAEIRKHWEGWQIIKPCVIHIGCEEDHEITEERVEATLTKLQEKYMKQECEKYPECLYKLKGECTKLQCSLRVEIYEWYKTLADVRRELNGGERA